MNRSLAVISLLLLGCLFGSPTAAQSAPRESAPREPRDSKPVASAPMEAAPGGFEPPERLDPPCDRVCTLEQKNTALEKYIGSLKRSLAARDAYIEALKKEVARLGAGGQ